MAEGLEKFFNEKLAMMPPEEYEIVGKGKSTKKQAKPVINSITGEAEEPPSKRGKKVGPVKPRSLPAGNCVSSSVLHKYSEITRLDMRFVINVNTLDVA